VELVGDRDHDRLDVRVRQHGGKVVVNRLGLVDGGQAVGQVLCDVADRVQVRVPRLADGVQVGRLGDRPAAEQADPQTPVVFLHDSTPLEGVRSK
jgi:hypothetical protein